MNRTISIAAAVAAALGTGTAAYAAPLLSAISAVPATNQVFIAGSSAAKNAVVQALEANICGGVANAYVFTSTGNKNFLAVSCVPVAAAGAANSGAYNFYYRSEGGSVVGMLPIVNNVPINQLALTSANFTANGCTDATPSCAIALSGNSETNGIDDSFGPAAALVKSNVDIGISDVEPGALIGQNYPSAYSTTVWGPTNPTGLVNTAGTQLFDEVYALFVNETTNFTQTPLNLSVQTIQQILTHKITNWSLVTDTAGALVTSASVPITIVNRENGSGSRTATDLVMAGDVCSAGGAPLFNKGGNGTTGATQYFAGGDVLAAAATLNGAITYATIDQVQAGLTQVNLGGVVPSNLAAASGLYPFWVEATYVQNSVTASDNNVKTFFEKALQTEATAPHLADVLAIPGIGSPVNAAHATIATSASTVAAEGPATIYVNPFTRAGVTCNAPGYAASAQ